MSMWSRYSPQTILRGPTSANSFESKGSYLEATAERRQPLCGNIEGWGPISPIRYDFTPCFLDVWISSVALFGVVFGAGAIWWLVKRNRPKPVDKDWHFYLKLVGTRIVKRGHAF
jgi:hypothetical protein